MSGAATRTAAQRRRRLWVALVILIVVALAVYFGVRALGYGSTPLDVTVTIRNTGDNPLVGLTIFQVDGPGHAIVPTIAPGAAVTVSVTADDHFRVSHLDLVDDATGRNYSLPPHQFDGSLRGSIDVQISRAGQGAALDGRARSSTTGADPAGWEPLRED